MEPGAQTDGAEISSWVEWKLLVEGRVVHNRLDAGRKYGIPIGLRARRLRRCQVRRGAGLVSMTNG